MMQVCTWGSPPLAREQLAQIGVFTGFLGITPARAGTTDVVIDPCFGSGDHPRSRGNNCVWAFLLAGVPGSPPLAREQHPFGHHGFFGQGITPARAGTTYFAT